MAKIQIHIEENHYILESDSRILEVKKDLVRKIRSLYCGSHGLTINALCRELKLDKKDFMFIKEAFAITHDDVPFIEEDLLEKEMEELVDSVLEEKKRLYYKKLEEMEIQQMRRELLFYRSNDYFLTKLLKALQQISPIEPIWDLPINFDIINGCEAVLFLSDWHVGLKTKNYFNEYNIAEFDRRLNKLLKDVYNFCLDQNVYKLHVVIAGDLIHGNLHVQNRIEAEIDTIQQVIKVTDALVKFLGTLAMDIPIIEVYTTFGNHGRLNADKSLHKDGENLEIIVGSFTKRLLEKVENIHFNENEYDDGIIVFNFNDSPVFALHGDKDKPKNGMASNLTTMLNLKPKYIFVGHYHSYLGIEEHMIDIQVSRSMSGVDDWVKNHLRKTAKAGQTLYVERYGNLISYDILF